MACDLKFLTLFVSLFLFRFKPILKIPPSIISSRLRGSRWKLICLPLLWEETSDRRRWVCRAPARPQITGECLRGRETAPPIVPWPYWHWTPTARKRYWTCEICEKNEYFNYTHVIVCRNCFYTRITTPDFISNLYCFDVIMCTIQMWYRLLLSTNSMLKETKYLQSIYKLYFL